MAVMVILALLASLRYSSRLQGRICDRARAAWNCDAGGRPARRAKSRVNVLDVCSLPATSCLGGSDARFRGARDRGAQVSDTRSLWKAAAVCTGVFAQLWMWRTLGRLDASILRNRACC